MSQLRSRVLGAQFGITAITARLLTPADFGLFAIANVVFMLAANTIGMGLIQAIVREPVLDREIIGSTVLLSCCSAAALAVIEISVAPLVARGSVAADGDALKGLLQLVSLAILISGIGIPAQAIMQRELRFRELGQVHLAALVFGMGATTVALAMVGEGPNSLGYGCIAYVTIVSAGCWWSVSDRWTITWRGAHIVRIGRVGMQMSLVRLLDALWTQAPLMIANTQLSAFDVGLYQRAQSLVDGSIQATCGRVSSVVFPVIAARQHHDEFLRELIPPLIGIYSVFLLSAITFVVFAASDIVALMLGPGWSDAAEPLILIMFAYAVLAISQPASSQLEARAVFRGRILGAGFGTASVTFLGFVLGGKYGLNGIAVSVAISGAGTAGINFLAAVTHLRISLRSVISWVLPAAGITGLLAAALIVNSFLISDRLGSPALRLATMTSIAFAVMALGFRLFMGRSKRHMLANQVLRGMSRPVSSIASIFGLTAGRA